MRAIPVGNRARVLNRAVSPTALAGALVLAVVISVSAAPASGILSEQFAIRSFPIPTVAGNPTRIALGSDGNLWFTEWGSNEIGRVTPRGAITEFPVPTDGASVRDIARGPDGAMWFTEGPVGTIGRITPSGRITEVRFGGLNAADSITAGPDGTIWFTETAANKV